MIRRLEARDWQALRAARLAALAEAPGNFFRPLAEDAARPDAHWRDMLARADTAIFGAFDGDELVGITGVYRDEDDPSGRTAAFGMTWLAPAYRGRGIAADYYRVRIGWAREQGFARIVVGHRASNEPSRRAMLAAGFRRTGASPYRWPDGAIEDDVMYELLLS